MPLPLQSMNSIKNYFLNSGDAADTLHHSQDSWFWCVLLPVAVILNYGEPVDVVNPPCRLIDWDA